MRENKRTINENRRKLADSDITIRNNTDAMLILKSSKNGGSLYILEAYEDTDMPFEDLRSIAKNHKRMFETFKIIIEDVYCPYDDEITVEDLEAVLGFRNHKKGLSDTPDTIMFDDMLLDYSVEEFERELRTFDIQLIERVMERAIYLYKKKEFSNSFKMDLLEKKLKVEYIFESIDMN